MWNGKNKGIHYTKNRDIENCNNRCLFEVIYSTMLND